MADCAATFYAFIRVAETGTRWSYLGLGAAVGVGGGKPVGESGRGGVAGGRARAAREIPVTGEEKKGAPPPGEQTPPSGPKQNISVRKEERRAPVPAVLPSYDAPGAGTVPAKTQHGAPAGVKKNKTGRGVARTLFIAVATVVLAAVAISVGWVFYFRGIGKNGGGAATVQKQGAGSVRHGKNGRSHV